MAPPLKLLHHCVYYNHRSLIELRVVILLYRYPPSISHELGLVLPTLAHRELNNEAALNLAKRQVEAWYPVVGVLEEVNATLALLQHHLPHYFAGVLDLYHTELLGKGRGMGTKV